MKIEILGTGCYNCVRLESLVNEVLQALGKRDVQVVRISDDRQIRRYMSLDEIPGLVIDGKLASTREVPGRQTLLGNLLAILFGVANPAQEKRILDYLKQVGIADPYRVRVLHPIIYPGSKDWREYYRNNNLNLPEQYHNGGIWPFVGGFYVAALVKAGRLDEAGRQLEKLAEVNRQGINEEWEFNEWCHGRSGQPMGYPHQAWSAGMYIFAYHCVAQGCVPLLTLTASEPVPIDRPGGSPLAYAS